ncbi:glycosyltransferase family 4 protein [Paenibacillus doosanensis]|uniref:glycosyltransferase family 4 protein n=1 Tax=Paenibacillus doosanensis TaxID=1229154 RepID=UPI00218068D9|nr:glycosyltransferase family 4 protein [Paenibacillus doosanensis]MCS7459895.1 glycosyltransferase family 4 protein [Paenibacillus doosanensis]
MKSIWLVNPYGPIEGENWRDYSFNQFGKYLSENGYKVVWWTSNFAHHFKKFRSTGWKDIQVNNNYTIRLVPTTSYKKNMSFGRFIKDIVFAYNAYQGFCKHNKPDIIISADTPLTMSYPSFSFAKKNNVPIIYDQMDLWPEFIENAVGKKLGNFLHALFYPIYSSRRRNYNKLDGVVALGKNYLKKTFEISASLQSKPHALIYNGIDVEGFRSKMLNEVDVVGLPKTKSPNEVWCIFAGTLGPSYDIQAILECANKLDKDEEYKQIFKFVIAGSGPLEEVVKENSLRVNNLYYVGKLLPEQLIPIYNLCDIGLAAYSEMSNVDMPDKFYDYTAAGLAIINSLNGEIQEYIDKYMVGAMYTPGQFESLTAAILKTVEKNVLEQMKNNSYKLAKSFDKKVQSNKLVEVIKKVLNETKEVGTT